MISQDYLMAIVSSFALYMLFVIVWAVILYILSSLIGRPLTLAVSLLSFLGSILLEIVRNLEDAQYLTFRPFFWMISATFLIAGFVVSEMLKRDIDGKTLPANKTVLTGCQVGYLIVLIFWVNSFKGLSEIIKTQLYGIIGRLVLVEAVLFILISVVLVITSRKKA